MAFKTVVHGDADDGRVRQVDGMLVLVGSARAIGISMAERRRRARRMAIRVAPGLVVGMLVLMVVSMACSALDSERLIAIFSGSKRPARGWWVMVDDGSSLAAERDVVTVEDEAPV